MRIPDIDFHGQAWPSCRLEATAGAWGDWLRPRLAPLDAPLAMVMANHPEAVALFFALAMLPCPIILLPPDARAWETSPPIPTGTRLALPPSGADLATAGERLGLEPCLLEKAPVSGAGAAPAGVLGGTPGVVAFTSGSTGRARPVYRSMASLIMEGNALIRAFALRPGDGVVSALPLSGVHGFVNVLVVATRLGSRVGLLERLDHREMLRLFASGHYRYWCGTPLMADVLARCSVVRVPSAPAVCVTGAGRLTASVASAFRQRFGVALRPGYGNTENGVITAHAVDRDDVDPETVGWAAPGLAVVIGEDPDHPSPPGEAGPVWFRSPWYMEGYGFPPALERRQGRDGWWPTGDVGVLDQAGRLRLLGRTDDCFKTATGYLVNPATVESALAAHPAVREVVVMAVEGLTGPMIGAAVEATDPTTTDELRRHAAATLPTWARPQSIVIVERLPRHQRGKPDRVACRALLEGAPSPDGRA